MRSLFSSRESQAAGQVSSRNRMTRHSSGWAQVRKFMTSTESLRILGQMKLDGHVDPDLFDIFVRERVYLRYALQFMESGQIDDVDVSRIPGYTGG